MKFDRQTLIIPGAIVLAGAIIAVSVYLMRVNNVMALPTHNPAAVSPVNPETDHVVGNPEAPVVIIEYADIDGEYSKDFQRTMAQLMTEYGPGGQVAWVYRHLPIIDLHPDAALHAEAAECAAMLAGESAFWRFIDLVQAAAPDVNQFDPQGYAQVAAQLGIAPGALETCVAGKQFEGKITADIRNALEAGAEGAPYTVVLVEGMEAEALEGALPYEAMKRVIDESIARSAR